MMGKIILLMLMVTVCEAQKLFFRPKQPLEAGKQLTKKLFAKKLNEVQCDSTYQCPDGNTCCKLSNDKWGCCPLPQATCCSDGVHCCPHGYNCSIGTSSCTKGDLTSDMVRKTPAIAMVNNVVCPDGTSECPNGNTCCKLNSGAYGCCPLPSATCCSDGVHCCPHGYNCSIGTSSCTKGDLTFKMVRKTPTIAMVNNVVCPGRTSECHNGNTCCKLSSGAYGCCPLPTATCCSDGVHCCPHGYNCSISTRSCTKGDLSSDMVRKTSAITMMNNVVCPDGTSECPNGNTCCKLSSGAYGCCPYPDATCCSDKVHCCPHGYSCSMSEGTCRKGDLTSDMVRKSPAISKVKKDICQDEKKQCPDGNTCCKMSRGGYGCCPLANGVCCHDDNHCCPHGYVCREGSGICRLQGFTAAASDFLQKLLPNPKKSVPFF